MEKMNRPAPYVDASANRYAASQMQQMSAQRHNALMNKYSGRPDSLPAEQGLPLYSSRAEGQWQWDKNEPNELNSSPSLLYMQGQGGNAAQSVPQGRMADQKVDIEKQANNDPRLQSHEQDMEIGYEDKPSQLTFEGLEQKFQDEMMKLVKELSDAEDAENARHREKLIEINTQFQANLSSLRAQHAKRREEFLHKESQVRLHQYQQVGMGNHLTERGPSDPRGFGGAVAETPRSYGAGQSDFYRERSQFHGGGRSQGSEVRVPYPQGRVYNNAGARYY